MSGVGRRGGWGRGGGEGEDEALAGGISEGVVFLCVECLRCLWRSLAGVERALKCLGILRYASFVGGELCEQEEYGIEGLYKVSHGVRSTDVSELALA